MEQAGNTVIPLRSSLPEKCFAALEATGETIVVHRGVMGYTPTGQAPTVRESSSRLQRRQDLLKRAMGLRKAPQSERRNEMVMKYMGIAEKKFDNGADRKEWVLAMVKASSETVNYDIDVV